MKLLIVESPAKAKTINKYLGKDFVVKASVGHVRDLPKSNKKAIDIKGDFTPFYEIVAGKEKVIDELKKDVKKADEIYLATDPDREGESISWHLSEALGLKYPKAKRIVFNEITKDAVKEALEHPREIDTNLRRAQEARRVLDRLFGYDLSGLIWKKVRYGLSAGRVQSPALRILVEREREIKNFIPETYYVLGGQFETKEKALLTLASEEEPKEKAEAERIQAAGRKGTWLVKDVKESTGKRDPRPPFITSTLQQAASTLLGFSPSRTMMLAQRLYEVGAITYMRTDSVNLSEAAQKQILKFIHGEFGDKYPQANVYKTKSKTAQEAHEAIRPTAVTRRELGADEAQKKLYKLIWARTVASQMRSAELLKTKIIANIKEDRIPNFSVNGARILFDGWLKLDLGKSEEVILPEVKTGDPLKLIEFNFEEKQTTPPPRFSEAGLVKELEKREIGRPSTYAAIIKTLEDRGYVEKINRSLKPTDTGEVVSTFIEENFGKYISDTFTAEMESELDDIAVGKREYVKTLKNFYGPFTKDIKAKEEIAKITTLGEAPAEFKCPKCEKGMVIKLGRMGRFISCANYPECEGALTIEGHEIKGDEPIGNHPETGEPIFVKTGRFGPYVQLGIAEKGKKKGKTKTKPKTKPRMASIPKEKNPTEVSVADALVYLSLPRVLGAHPTSGKNITASIGRFGPYIVHDGDFRSLKKDDVYTITLPRALEILAEPKKPRGFARKKKAE
jgi:DNA topoisomerase-1